MIREFELRRLQQQIEAQRQQSEAERSFSDMFTEATSILGASGDYRKGRLSTTFMQIVAVCCTMNFSEGSSTPKEVRHTWKLRREVDLDGEAPERVVLTGSGSKNPAKMTRVTLFTESGNHFLELRKDEGVLVEKRIGRKGIICGGKRENADLSVAQTYQNVLRRLRGVL